MILSMALLTRCLADATARQAGWTGWWYGLGLFAPGLQWIYVSLNDFGKLPLVVSFLILGGLFAIMAGYTALACWFCNRVTPRYGFRRVLLVFPFSWVLVEWLRGHLFSGFAWLSAGYSQIDSPLSGFAPVGGVMLVGMLTVLLAGLLPMFFRSRREQLIALAVVVEMLDNF